MTITSTQFQQRIGYYLELASQGEEIEITKSKPIKQRFLLKVQPKVKTIALNAKKKMNGELIWERIKDLDFHMDLDGLDVVTAQRRVRS